MVVTRKCSSLKQAERWQMRLYNKYTTVRLFRWPAFSEDGFYSWHVSNKSFK